MEKKLLVLSSVREWLIEGNHGLLLNRDGIKPEITLSLHVRTFLCIIGSVHIPTISRFRSTKANKQVTWQFLIQP